MDKKYIAETPSNAEEMMLLLEDRIYEYNSSKLEKYDGHYFARIVRDENKDIIAGIGGWAWAGICEITQLWVDGKFRKNGIGKLLLAAAENEAKSKACHTILVRSYSFQAPHFYEKHGYKTRHVITNFPEGHNYYFLTKMIA